MGLRMLVSLLIALAVLCGDLADLRATPLDPEFAKRFSREVGPFKLVGTVRPSRILLNSRPNDPLFASNPAGYPGFKGAEVDYVSPEGEKFSVEVIRVERDSDAYSLLTLFARNARETGKATNSQMNREIGTASFSAPGTVAFFKGINFVVVSNASNPATDSPNLATLGKLLAEGLDKGEGDVPILVKHLPKWESAQANVVYLAGFRSLKELLPNQPVLDAVSSEGDADAVSATYGTSKFVLVEFNTPQLAGDNDRTITAKINELRQLNQPLPTSYRKVGNYSVFVFNAPSEAEANQLIDQVEYAQMVQWLGNNPYLLEQAQKEYYETTAGVLVSVVKASGLSLLICLGVGGVIGALLFNRRRAQQRAAEAYSDAGGMLRLNLDEITPQRDPARLLRP